jgi:hypothetical protein
MPKVIPTEILELSGAFKINPQRRRPRAIKSKHPLGEPPKDFKPAEAQCWAELQWMIPPTVLVASDRWTVEMACRLMAKLRIDKISGPELGKLSWCLGVMGATPVDRARLTAPPEAPSNPFEEFIIQ